MAPNCFKCKHFFVTFDPQLPRGCRAYGVKSSSVPSQVVKNANAGSDCLGFEPKEAKKRENAKKDLNDPKYWQA